MENEDTFGQVSGAALRWLRCLGGCALGITSLCSLALAVLVVASTALNIYLAWSLSGYEVAISRPTSIPSAVAAVTPASEQAIIPAPTSTAVPTSTPLPVSNPAPTSTPLPLPTATPTRTATPIPTQSTPEAESAPPTATQVAGMEVGGTDAASTSTSSSMAAAPDTSSAPGESAYQADTYVVQQGDTLWLIAVEDYGAGWLWEAIYEANRDVLDDPSRIRPGQVLKIPPKP
jgi:nucleoid-associated protein YgaU